MVMVRVRFRVRVRVCVGLIRIRVRVSVMVGSEIISTGPTPQKKNTIPPTTCMCLCGFLKLPQPPSQNGV